MSAAELKIVLVDSDEQGRRLLELGLRKEGFAVVSRTSAADAESALSEAHDVVVSDVSLSDASGRAWIERLRRASSAPIVVVTTSAHQGMEAEASEAGARAFLIKPVRMKDLSTTIREAVVERAAAAEVGERTGSLADEEVFDLVTEAQTEKLSGALRLESNGASATIYFENGEVIDAVSGRQKGADAFYRAYSWNDGTYTLLIVPLDGRPRSIELETTDLIGEAMAYTAELEDARGAAGSLDAVYTVEYKSLVASAGDFPPQTDAVVRTFDGIRSVADVIAATDVNELAVLKVVAALRAADVLQPVDGSAPPAPEDDFEALRRASMKLAAASRTTSGKSEIASAPADEAKRKADEAAQKAKAELERARELARQAEEAARAAEREALRIAQEQERERREAEEKARREEEERRRREEEARRRAEEARKKAEEEARKKAEEEARKKAEEERKAAEEELERLSTEMAELEKARVEEMQAAERRAEEVRREAEMLAQQLRTEAARKASELEQKERELAQRKVRLTGRVRRLSRPVEAVPVPEPAAVETSRQAELDAAREAERRAIADEKPVETEPSASSNATIADAIANERAALADDADEPDTDSAAGATLGLSVGSIDIDAAREPNLPSSSDTTPSAEPASAPASAEVEESAGKTLGLAAGGVAAAAGTATESTPEPAPKAEVTEPASADASAAGGAGAELDHDFFNAPAEYAEDDDLFAEPEDSSPNPTLIALIAVFVIGGIFIALISMNNNSGDEEGTEEEADEEVAEPVAPEETTPEPEPVPEVEPEEPAEPTAEEILQGQRIEAGFTAQTIGSGMAYAGEEIAREIQAAMDAAAEPVPAVVANTQPVQTTTTPDPMPTPDPTPDPDPEPEPAADGDADRALRNCAAAYQAGNYSETISACEEAAAVNSSSADAFVYLGSAHYELGQSADAVRYLERAVRFDRRNRNALLQLGAARQDLGDAAGARQAYEQYLEYYPDSRRADEIRTILESL